MVYPLKGRILAMSEEYVFEGSLDDLDLDELEEVIDHVTDKRPWDMRHSDLVDKDFIVLGYKPQTTTFGDALLVDAIVDGNRVAVLLGGSVLIPQLKEAFSGKPMRAKIRKVGRYYSFVK